VNADDLQHLELPTILDPAGIVGKVAIYEGVRLTTVHEPRSGARGAANIFDDIDVAPVVRVDALISTFAEERIERVDLRRPVDPRSGLRHRHRLLLQ